MRAGSGAHFTTLPGPLCAVCEGSATTTIVPKRGARQSQTSAKFVHVTTMRLCALCRSEVVSGRIKLGWSWQAERWGLVDTDSPAGDRYLRLDP
jgi:hypothetical protein